MVHRFRLENVRNVLNKNEIHKNRQKLVEQMSRETNIGVEQTRTGYKLAANEIKLTFYVDDSNCWKKILLIIWTASIPKRKVGHCEYLKISKATNYELEEARDQ